MGYDGMNIFNILEKLAAEGKYLIHFSNLKDRVGINPRSGYGTPIGIYCYPLDQKFVELWKERKIPFAGDRSYMHILELNDGINEVIVSKSEISYSEYANKVIDFITYKFGDLGDTLKDWEKMIQNTDLLYKETDRAIRKFGGGNVKLADKSGSVNIWYFTFVVSYELSMIVDGSKRSVLWNSLLRNSGIDVFTDLGYGVIHPNEPIQSVILNPIGYSHKVTLENYVYDALHISNAIKQETDLHRIYNMLRKALSYLDESSDKYDPEFLGTHKYWLKRSYYYVLQSILNFSFDEMVKKSTISKISRTINIIQKIDFILNDGVYQHDHTISALESLYKFLTHIKSYDLNSYEFMLIDDVQTNLSLLSRMIVSNPDAQYIDGGILDIRRLLYSMTLIRILVDMIKDDDPYDDIGFSMNLKKIGDPQKPEPDKVHNIIVAADAELRRIHGNDIVFNNIYNLSDMNNRFKRLLKDYAMDKYGDDEEIINVVSPGVISEILVS
jgi:hypothetical protein